MQKVKAFMVDLCMTALVLVMEFIAGTIFLYIGCQCLGKEFTWSLAVGVFALMQMVCMYFGTTSALTRGEK